MTRHTGLVLEPDVPDDYGPATYGDGFADVYDDWYHDVSDVDATVATIAELAGDGAVLELGVGTGRLAVPLAAAGATVVGVDASQAMLDLLTAKDPDGSVVAVLTDMAALTSGPAAETIASHGPYRVVFAAFNTLFNLTTPEDQARCLNNAFELLEPGGYLVIEGFVPPEGGLGDGGVSVRDVTPQGAVITVSRHDRDAQIIRGHHVELTAEGNRLRPWMLHYRTPTQLDEAAASVGFVLEARWSDWHGTNFDESAELPDVHVSRYQRPK